MQAKYLLIGLIFSIFGCVSAKNNAQPIESLRVPSVQPALSIVQVEQLKMGITTSDEVIKLLGQPQETVRIKMNGSIVWIYNHNSDGQSIRKLMLNFDSVPGVIQVASWTPSGDELSSLEATLSHFKSAKFNVRDEGQVSKDSYSANKIYSDEKSGIALGVNQYHQTVSSIDFYPPKQKIFATKFSE